jgi:hypothetical protein
MRQFGRLKRLDFKQRRSGDAFAFATFEDLNDATLAVKSFQGEADISYASVLLVRIDIFDF